MISLQFLNHSLKFHYDFEGTHEQKLSMDSSSSSTILSLAEIGTMTTLTYKFSNILMQFISVYDYNLIMSS